MAKIKCPECYGATNEFCVNPLDYDNLGMFHCPGCGQMQVAGVPHINCSTCNGVGVIDDLNQIIQ
jgi:hypothetical protein